MEKVVLRLNVPSVEAEILFVSYLLTAILNFAATGRQGIMPSCSGGFWKSRDLTYHHAKFQKDITKCTLLVFVYHFASTIYGRWRSVGLR